jgi:hypothetical protein
VSETMLHNALTVLLMTVQPMIQGEVGSQLTEEVLAGL